MENLNKQWKVTVKLGYCIKPLARRIKINLSKSLNY